MAGVQRAVPPSKHARGRLKPMGQRSRRLRARAKAQRIRAYLDRQAFERAIQKIEGSDGPGA